ncbi:hypothetical protein [Candidatus Enterovibrio altilux]|uniref:Mobile element protein n=1 Tax=Candidatus Enterovibrio altilux TaxID=1927128 RepID=A0A291BAJ8_9GAMM|nr:Mobile element protein [Candidatus Enterovibrio luxaltus]
MVYINTHEVIASELSASHVTDGELLPNLLKQQTPLKINEISTNSAYDTKQYYEIARIKQAVSLIPPKKKQLLENEVIRAI